MVSNNQCVGSLEQNKHISVFVFRYVQGSVEMEHMQVLHGTAPVNINFSKLYSIISSVFPSFSKLPTFPILKKNIIFQHSPKHFISHFLHTHKEIMKPAQQQPKRLKNKKERRHEEEKHEPSSEGDAASTSEPAPEPRAHIEAVKPHEASPPKQDEKHEKTDDDAGSGGLDEEDKGGSIQLISKDKQVYHVEQKHAFISNLIKTTLEQDAAASEVNIPGVESAVLQKVIEYMKHHKGTEPPIIPKPLRSKEMKQVCSDQWDAVWIDKIGDTRQDLYDLILAANYMDIKSLLHLGCAKVASLIKGQPMEKIKEILAKGTSRQEGKGDSKKAAMSNPDQAAQIVS